VAEFDLARYNRRTGYIALIAFAELVALGFLWYRGHGSSAEELAPPPVVDARLSRVPPPPSHVAAAAPAPTPSEEIATITLSAPAPSGAPRASSSGKPSAPASAPPASLAAPPSAPSPAASAPTAAAGAGDSRADEEPVVEYRPSARADALLGIAPAADPAPPPSDQSSPARLGANVEWHCPWPSSADAARIDHASVRLRAQVKADGQASSIAVLNDPGLGFGEQARSCAMGHVFVPARDKNGNATVGSTLPFVVQFDRFQMITK
jgi:hypothetical protein